MRSWALGISGGIAVYAGSVYGTLLYLKSQKCPCDREADRGCRCENKFDGLADSYDSSVSWDEFVMGVPWLRWALVARASGKVLEICSGTGRNMRYYDPESAEHVVFSDRSYAMLLAAKRKWEMDTPGYSASFVCMDAQALGEGMHTHEEEQVGKHVRSRWQWLGRPRGRATAAGQTSELQPADLSAAILTSEPVYRLAPAQFDTVVDTFGLCSCPDPVRVLRETAQVLKPGGRVLLLEHGRSSWGFLNRILDADAAKHFECWGCWWNRDILAIVEEAGLEVTEVSRWHFGTTYWIAAQVPQDCHVGV